MIRHILWDLDGTLFDTYPAITFAISVSLNELGQSLPLNIIDRMARLSLNHYLENLSERYNLDHRTLYERYSAHYDIVEPANQPPFEGVREVCEWIQQHGGLNLVVTHRPLQPSQRLLDVHGMAPFFSGIFSLEQGYPRKPDPALFFAALRQFGLQPQECLVVGDRELDVQGGHAAGCPTCLFGPAASDPLPDLRIHRYSELLDILRRQDGRSDF